MLALLGGFAELFAAVGAEVIKTPPGAGEVDEPAALAAYHRERDLMLREVFEITCELSTFPPPDRFAELQKQLSAAIDAQSAALVAKPAPATVLVPA